MDKDKEKLAELRSRIFTEPSSEYKKADIVSYIKILVNEASQLPADLLVSDKGHDIAIRITGALAFQGAQGVEGDDWITEEREPLLFEILSVAGKLDASPANESAWERLFLLAEKLVP